MSHRIVNWYGEHLSGCYISDRGYHAVPPVLVREYERQTVVLLATVYKVDQIGLATGVQVQQFAINLCVVFPLGLFGRVLSDHSSRKSDDLMSHYVPIGIKVEFALLGHLDIESFVQRVPVLLQIRQHLLANVAIILFFLKVFLVVFDIVVFQSLIHERLELYVCDRCDSHF